MVKESIAEKIDLSLSEINSHLYNGIINFWRERAIDVVHGGYFTYFDADGNAADDTDKYLVTQTRMIWGYSALYRKTGEQEFLDKAVHGVNFFISKFWDADNLGWCWKTSRSGLVLDNGKVVYGQSFAIYALAEFYLASKDLTALAYAEKTFEALQIFALDTKHGGYFENLEHDWMVSDKGFCGGDRKSLDIHMHLMEAFTNLFVCTGKEIHKRRLMEVTDLLIHKMLHQESGCGLNQFDLNFNPIPAINIRRTWNAERAVGEIIETPTDTTSYGHNIELAWLLNRTGDVLGFGRDYYKPVVKKLLDYSIQFGLDKDLGGVYRDGTHNGIVLVKDKEWWQNCEVLVGFLDAYDRYGDEVYFEAFFITWKFDAKYFINHDLGEWRQLLSSSGEVIIGDLGNPWKAFYHTGRSMLECIERLESIKKKNQK